MHHHPFDTQSRQIKYILSNILPSTSFKLSKTNFLASFKSPNMFFACSESAVQLSTAITWIGLLFKTENNVLP